MAKIYGYCRCSTNETRQDVDRQVKELRELGAVPETIYKEYITGTAATKTELNKLLAIIEAGDTIAVTEISRLSRSTKQLCELIELIQEKKIKLVIKNSITIDCTNGTLDPMTKAFLEMAAVFAELEHGMIKERVKSGMRTAAAKRKRIGRPALTAAGIPAKVKEHYTNYTAGSINKTDFAKLCGISRPTLDKYLQLMEQDT